MKGVVAERGSDFLFQFDGGVVAFHRKTADQTCEERRGFFAGRLIAAVQTYQLGPARAGRLSNSQGFARQQQGSQVVEREGSYGTIGVAVEERRAIAGSQNFNADMDLVKIDGRPYRLFPLE